MYAVLTRLGAQRLKRPELEGKVIEFHEFSTPRCIGDTYYQGEYLARHLEFGQRCGAAGSCHSSSYGLISLSLLPLPCRLWAYTVATGATNR